ncbi:MAG: hypothetical protein JNK64_26650 [Myxococcales bacterium]|nr:hypothetical protein [Myxococcales bacterium]
MASRARPLSLGAALAALAACAPVDGPRLDGLDPAAARRGATVTLTGRDLCGGTATATGACDPLPSGAVDFGLSPPMVRAPVRSWADAEIRVTVPSQVAAGATSVYVTVDGRTSNALDFEVLP